MVVGRTHSHAGNGHTTERRRPHRCLSRGSSNRGAGKEIVATIDCAIAFSTWFSWLPTVDQPSRR